MLIKFECNNVDCHNDITKFFKNAKEIPPFLDCGECSVGKLERILFAPTSKSTQFIDNGSQARRVEVNSEAVLKQQSKVENMGND